MKELHSDSRNKFQLLMNSLFKIARIVAFILLLIANSSNPDSYYVVLRFIICAVSIYSVWAAVKARKTFWLWGFCIIAFLFNPIIPLHLSKQLWVVIDMISALLFLLSVPLLNPTEKKPVAQKKNENRTERETRLWERSIPMPELKNLRHYIISELSKMKTTNWEDYALKAICTHSPKLSKLMVDGNLNIKFIKQHEKKGVDDAINAVQSIKPHWRMPLRHYFHKLFKKIYKDTSYGQGNKFYWYGRDRVIEILRSYRASIKEFTPSETKFYDIDGEELMFDTNIDAATINKVKESLDYFEKSVKAQTAIEEAKKYYRFKIESDHPVIEFDLETIEKIGNFKYEGSLINSLYIELKNLLSIGTDYAYLGYRATSEKLFDARAVSFAFERGIIVLIKYKGAVAYYPDRIYIELQDIDLNGWIMRWLKSYKLHLEGND